MISVIIQLKVLFVHFPALRFSLFESLIVAIAPNLVYRSPKRPRYITV